MKHTVATGALVLALAAASPEARAQDHAHHDSHEVDADVVENPNVIVHVKGLACEMCARSLTNELKKIEAIAGVQILLEEDQRALVKLSEDTSVTEEELRKAVTDAGFSVRSVVFVKAKP